MSHDSQNSLVFNLIFFFWLVFWFLAILTIITFSFSNQLLFDFCKITHICNNKQIKTKMSAFFLKDTYFNNFLLEVYHTLTQWVFDKMASQGNKSKFCILKPQLFFIHNRPAFLFIHRPLVFQDNNSFSFVFNF